MIQADTLKPGWKLVKFGDVVRLSKERAANPEAEGIERYVGLEHIDPDDLRIRRWGLVAEGTTFTSKFKPGQVLFGKRRAYQRKVAVADFEGVCSGDIYVFESANPSVLLPELLPFICQTDRFFEYAVGTSSGSLSPRTNWTSLAKFEFALPPLKEQKQFINLLSNIDNTFECINYLAHSIFNLHEAYIVRKLSEIYRNVPTVSLSDMADVQYGLTINSKRRNANLEIPYLRVANVQRANLNLDEIKYTGKLEGDETFLLHKGDVLIVEGHADSNEVGRSAVWLEDETEMFHQNHLIRVRCQSQLIPEYLCSFINSKFGRNYFRSCAKSTSGLNTLNSTVVKLLKIPVPTVKQQQLLVETSKEYVQAYTSLLKRLNELKVIKQCFLAKLEVRDVQRSQHRRSLHP
ncbi:restriction endonuclease subunit S [Pelatocladus sp. BLCC-F211]|uniref:restriction endonuclease subunit S n=1 Tax=Pelatocladus sp. BLCC-F211 TaxID=3342752 RepID=UPI0035BA09D1